MNKDVRCDNLFCAPITIINTNIKNKEVLLKFCDFHDSYENQILQCERSNQLVNLKYFNSLVKEILDNFYLANEKIYQYNFENLKPFISSLWANKFYKGQNISLHFHPNSWYSGVYYPYGTGDSKIIFENHIVNNTIDPPKKVANKLNSSSWEYKFDEETMIFFPSYMRHMTSIVIDDNPRISFSFNIFLRGILSNTITQNLIL